MPGVKTTSKSRAEAVEPPKAAEKSAARLDLIRRQYVGKFVAWAPDGLRIVAVGSSFELAERKAARACYPKVAVARIPKRRNISK